MRRCFRCQGRTKMYRVGSAYSMTDMGGVEVDCPLCAGKGEIKVMVKRKRVLKVDFKDVAKEAAGDASQL